MKEMIEMIVRAFVDEPELVSISEIGGMHTSILQITVEERDIGKIIGDQGRTASALRSPLNVISARAKKRTMLEILS